LLVSRSAASVQIDIDTPSSLHFANQTIKYFNTNEAAAAANLWNPSTNPAQTFASAVCVGKYVYFGTKSSTSAAGMSSVGVTSTIVRVDPRLEESDPRKYVSIGEEIAKALDGRTGGDLTFGAVWWADDVIFAMEPPEASEPLSFVVAYGGDGFGLKHILPIANPLPQFQTLSGLYANPALRRIIVANKNGDPWIAEFDLSHENSKTGAIAQTLSLKSSGLAPAAALVVDDKAKYAYVVLGDCSVDDVDASIAVAAVRLVPDFHMAQVLVEDPAVFQCATHGLPSSAVLITKPNDLDIGAPKRHLQVLTLLDTISTTSPTPSSGTLLPFTTPSAGRCSQANCHESDHRGVCVGMQCLCGVAWQGNNCDLFMPCGGTNCTNNGICSNTGMCSCFAGFQGDDCSVQAPCRAGCSDSGICVRGICQCNTGFTGDVCEHKLQGCELLNNCSTHGTCADGYPSGSCSCTPPYAGDDCSLLHLPCPNNCTGKGLCNTQEGKCVCGTDWTGVDCSEVVAACENNCSAHGKCQYGKCFCEWGYKGSDCSTIDPNSCPHMCSGHGTCNHVTQNCVCAPGWELAPDCSQTKRDIRMAAHAILTAGENRATTSFTLSTANFNPSQTTTLNTILGDHLVVFCLGTSPAKCMLFDGANMAPVSECLFEKKELAGSAAAAKRHTVNHLQIDKNNLGPSDILLEDVLVQLSASEKVAPITVSLVEDVANGYAIVGTAQASGAMHGMLYKLSTRDLSLLSSLELSDDNGRGVTCGCKGANSTFFISSGNNPASIYQVSKNLEILNRASASQSPPEELIALAFDGNKHLVAAGENTLYIYNVERSSTESSTASLDASVTSPTLALPSTFGTVTVGVGSGVGSGEDLASEVVTPTVNTVFFGTAGSPAAVVGVTFEDGAAPRLKTFRLSPPHNHITTATRFGDLGYFGLASDTTDNTCSIVVLSLSAMRQMDLLSLTNCSSDLISSSVSADGLFAYFGNGASPAHVYTVRLFARENCPRNCSGRGSCVQGTCSCHAGWMGDTCSVVIPTCLNNCSQAGQCNKENYTCICTPGHSGADCSIVEHCSSSCQHGTCTGLSNTWPCTCESAAWGGKYCSEPLAFCPNECSRHGTCDHGTCKCHVGYAGTDCSTETFPPVSLRGCVTDTDCGTHGVCHIDRVGTGVCTCAPDWSGEDCDIDENLRRDMQSNESAGGLSIGIVVGIVVAAAVLGVVVGVSIWKSWANSKARNATGVVGNSGKAVSGRSKVLDMEAGTYPSKAAKPQPNYARLPRRLVK